MEPMNSFFIGTLGAFVGFAIYFKHRFLPDFRFVKDFELRSVLIGFFIVIVVGGLYTTFVMDSTCVKHAFLGGLTAEGSSFGILKKSNKEV
jgi:Kef-type K+ transport system membrane component KefB